MNVLIFSSHAAAFSEYEKLFGGVVGLEAFFFMNNEDSPAWKLDTSLNINTVGNNSVIKSYNKKIRWRTRVKGFLDNSLFGCILQHYILCRYLKNKLISSISREEKVITQLIELHSIDVMIVQSDRSLGVEAAALLASKNSNVKTFLLSFAYSADFKSSYKLRTSKIYSFLSGQPDRVVHRDKELGDKAFYRLFESLALDELGILSSNPWVLGSGCTEKMLLDSDRERNRIVSLGGQAWRYQVTGTKSQDDLYLLYQKAKKEKDDLCKDPLLVIALPQYFEHGLCDKISHFNHIRGMLEAVKKPSYRVKVSLHPKMLKEDYGFVESEFGYSISEGSVVDLIPGADIFLATYSSTVSWAILCDVQVIICDHIGLNYTDFYSEFHLPVVTSNIGLRKIIDNYLMLRDKKTRYSQDAVKQLAPFDGMSQQRILACLKGEG